MNFRLTITLAVLMLLLAIGYHFLPAKQSVEEGSTSASTPLFATKPKEIKSISYISDGQEELKFVHQGEQWLMAVPVSGPAETFQLQNISDTLRGIAYRQKFEPEATGYRSAESMGTAKPDRVVKFTDDAGKEYTLGFGKESVDGVYMTLNGQKTVYVVDKAAVDQFDKRPEQFRNKVMNEVAAGAKITSITVKTQNGTTTLNKTGEKWMISAPVTARANAAKVEEIVREMSRVTASGFTKLKRGEARLDQPVASVTIGVQEESGASGGASTATAPATKTVTLDLGVYTDIARKTAVYAAIAGSDAVFTLRSDAFDKLNRELKDLRDPAVTAAPVTTATGVAITAEGSPTLEVTRKDLDWTMTAGGAALSADAEQVRNYLTQIGGLMAINYLDHAGDLKSIGLDPPLMKVELTLPNQPQREVILVGKAETSEGAEKVTPVMRQGEPTVYMLQNAEAEKLKTSMIKLRNREIERVETDRIRTIAISGAAATVGVGPTTQPATTGPATAPATAPAPTPGVTLQREGLRWVVTSSAPGSTGLPADDVKVSSLLGNFRPLEAVKYVDDKADLGGTPELVVTLTMVEPTLNVPATQPAAGAAAGPASMPASAPATGPATAASRPASIALEPVIAPDPGKVVTRTLRLYRTGATTAPSGGAATGTWKGVWDNQTPAWTFEPTEELIEHVTKSIYTVSPPSTAPAAPTGPAGMPGMPFNFN